MSINPGIEDTFPLSDGPKKVGKSYSALKSYIDIGKKRRGDGAVVFLEKIMLTSGLGTSVEAYNRFIIRLNGADPLADTLRT